MITPIRPSSMPSVSRDFITSGSPVFQRSGSDDRFARFESSGDAPGAPGSGATLFDGTIYDRGGMTLQALRAKVGDPAFLRIMRDWAQGHRFENVTTPQFIALAQQLSGRDLTQFFDVWLYQPGKPLSW